ncbi:efflux RND transporter periplasmic adaptor subunit [Massilia sp. TS11]|uniref:efflux RND transporter periplasmic adaptor subunit n=1 Tax=Massilia sp. TS11 TaxID=2908003 RepID=UPI001EDC6B49|nr:efflux RND transporter periplasmic adaptor subunit [Massilia sp. TS11]
MSAPDLNKLSIDRNAKANDALQQRRRKQRVRRAIIAVVILGALGALGARQAMNSKPAVEVATASAAYPSQSYTLLNATGYVTAQRKAAISSKATGRLEWLGVLEGSHVKANEVIARLENRDVSAQLGQAQAAVKVAQANLEQAQAEQGDAEQAYRRATELQSQKFIAASSVDSALARLNKAKAAVSGARAQIAAAQAQVQAAQVALDQTQIRAPFEGVILTKSANVGDNITPFSSAADSKGAVVTMADMSTLEVEADVSESNLAKIAVDQPAEITLDAFPELHLAGTVSRMVPTVDRSKATLLVKVKFSDRDPRVLPDMSAKVAFLAHPVPAADRQPVIAAQQAVLAKRGGRDVVFVMKDDKLKETPVTTGRRIGELVELKGVRAGDKLVLNPGEKLADGMAVQLAKK